MLIALAKLVAMTSYRTPAFDAWRRRTDTPLVCLAVGSLPLLMLEPIRNELRHGDRVFLDAVNVIVLVAFAVDYAVEFALAKQRLRFVRHEWADLAIVVAQAVALAPAFSVFGLLRVFRAARLWRLLAVLVRFISLGRIAAKDGAVLLRRHAAGLALGVAAFTSVTSACAFTMVEDVGTNGRIGSFFDALWWSATSITTIGDGDISPVTAMGRAVGVFTGVIGLSTFATVTAKIAEFLVRVPRDT